jgi:hypothetical protein
MKNSGQFSSRCILQFKTPRQELEFRQEQQQCFDTYINLFLKYKRRSGGVHKKKAEDQ